MWRRSIVRALAVVALALGLGSSALPVHASYAAPSATPAATQRVDVRPVTATGHLRTGYTVVHRFGGTQCLASSIAVAKAYRCFAGNNEIFDPCWVQDTAAPNVICLPRPWSHRVVQLHVTKGYDGTASGGSRQWAWGFRLADGVRCTGVQGATSEVDGYRISFGCDDGKTVLLAAPDKSSSLWTIRAAHDVGNYHYKQIARQTITKAFYGRPSINVSG
jgi:hypothetical protein